MSQVFYYYDEWVNKVKTDNKKRNEKYFETEEEALKHFEIIKKEALNLFKQYKKEHEEFMKNKPFWIDYIMKGDTHGICEDYLCVAFEHKGFDFRFNLGE